MDWRSEITYPWSGNTCSPVKRRRWGKGGIKM